MTDSLKDPLRYDLTDQVFGAWTVRGSAGKDWGGSRQYWCRCVCGEERSVLRGNLLSGDSKSCGCLRPIQPKIGRKNWPEYRAWLNALQRTQNPNCPDYHYYGGRGIIMAPEWREDSLRFLADMGQRPSPKHSLDRIDVNGPYAPWNCRWATLSEQRRNRRPQIGYSPPRIRYDR